MQAGKRRGIWLATVGLGVGLAVAGLIPRKAQGFTQGVKHAQSVVPMGHEWITRLAGIEVIGGERVLTPDAKDARKTWSKDALAGDIGLTNAKTELDRIKQQLIAKKDDDRFAAIYKPVFDAILGERWVDIGGINFLEASKFDRINCLDAVTQEAPAIQYDHFMRKPEDVDGDGAIRSARESTQRFIEYFVAAATAQDGSMTIWDGGGWSDKHEVDRHYFMFGRALHLFEDSFSPDHTVRLDADHYRKLRQVKSYLCASGSEQHAHLQPPGSAFYATGDVIWKDYRYVDGRVGPDDWSAYQPSNMRDYALAATEGTKDAWAAFIRSMATAPASRAAFARNEAIKVAARWLAFDDSEMRTWYSKAANRGATYVKATPQHAGEDGGNGSTIEQCMARDWKGALQATKLKQFADERRVCLYNMLQAEGSKDVDASLKLAYDWRWRNRAMLETPPDDWQIDTPPRLTVKMRFANRVNQQFLREDGGYIYNDFPLQTPVSQLFTVASVINPAIPLSQNTVTFAIVGQSGKFMSRWGGVYGRVDIFSGDAKGHFSLERRADGYYNIKNVDDNEYMFMDSDQKTYISSWGKADNQNAQWRVEGLPEPYLVSGHYGFKFATPNSSMKVKDGKLVVGRYEGLGATGIVLDRQADGSYLFRIGAGVNEPLYVRVNTDRSLGVDAKVGSKFFIREAQRGGVFTLQTEDGRFWWADPKKIDSGFSMIEGTECTFDPCAPPSSDLAQRGDRAARAPAAAMSARPTRSATAARLSCSRWHATGRWTADPSQRASVRQYD